MTFSFKQIQKGIREKICNALAKQDEMKKTEEREGEKENKRTGERKLKHIIKSSKE